MQYNKEHTFDFMRAHRQDSKHVRATTLLALRT